MSLDDLRKQIDDIDVQIVELINERAKVAHKIGNVKNEDGDSIYKPHREQAVLDHAKEASCGPLPDESIQAVFREIMSACIALEKPIKVAYLGPKGTFTHWAARSQFGDSIIYESASSLADVFEEVERSRADYGVVPVENSTEGAIRETLALLLDSSLKICAEIVFEINHALMANCDLDEINTLYSKETVFGQTRQWLRKHLPDARQVDVASTGRAAELAGQEDNAAAIGHAGLAGAYGLDVLFDRIQDRANNETRFFVLGEHMSDATGDDKTAILCSVKDHVGALHDMLHPFKEHRINMTKIESFPSQGGGWKYHFFIDFLGHPEEQETRVALEQMGEHCDRVKILGAFPRRAE